MKYAFLAVLLAGGVIAASSASAQQPVRANERYCIEVLDDTGPNPWECRFETYAQCLASKTSPGDKCWLNPYLAFQQRR
jgi:hypothetical protein